MYQHIYSEKYSVFENEIKTVVVQKSKKLK